MNRIMNKMWKRALAFLLVTALGIGAVDVPVVYAQEKAETGSAYLGTNETATDTDGQTENAVAADGTTAGDDTDKSSVETETGGWDQVTTQNVFEGDSYRVTFTLTSFWGTGYNANIQLENTGNCTIQNWKLGFEFDNAITNIWNAEICEIDGKKYVVGNVGWNQDIAVGGSIAFGISGDHAFGGFPENYELIGTIAEVKAEDYTVEYHSQSDWGSGFTGAVVITNHTDAALEDWVLEFDFDREITEIWNGIIEAHEGNHYIVRNATYNSTIIPGGSVSFGIKGSDGETGDEPSNYVLYSYGNPDGYVIKFCVGAEDVSNVPRVQIVGDGDYINKPQNPRREGYYFVGWYTDEGFTEKFDFANTVVNGDVTLYARWLDYLCKTDTDQDGIVDSLEEYFGTDIFAIDSDQDGLTDYEEVYITGTNPLVADTDNNGIDDYHDDIDKDGISNGDEVKNGTNPAYYDTDLDGLSDYEEMYKYFTDPILKDTDADGAPDGWEIQNGYDPLVYDDSFVLSVSTGTINEANPVVASVNVEVYNADVNSLNIDKVKSHDNCYITPSIAGYIGDAYDFTLNGEFDVAELVFEYDVNIGQINEEFQPRIYYFNEELKAFEELDNQVVENGKVIAETTHFSTYILLNKIEFDKVWNNEIKPFSEGGNINIAFVVDLSDSMAGTKLSTTKAAVNSFIDVLGNKDKAAIVSFNSSATIRCSMTNDKNVLKNAVTNMRTNGITSIYKGIDKGISVFENVKTDACKMMIVFTDGYDVPATNYDTYYKALVENAKEKDIVIYTIGIGTIDKALLNKVAESTGGKYYYASVISELQGKVDEIKDETLDYQKDSNNDGISDYYTKLIEEGTLVLSNSSNELKGINLNYDDKGNLTDDCDGDGLKNGEEIKVVEKNGKIYLEMISHPLRKYSDGDLMSDYEEVQNGTDPLCYEVNKNNVDRLCTDGFYYFETTANDLRDDDFVRGLVGYSAIINGVWNKQELYRDLIIDYYSTYVTQDIIDDMVTDEEKKLWYDTLVTWSGNANQYGKVPYDTIYNVNKLISYVNGVASASELEGDFVKRVSSTLVELNKLSEDATEMRFDIAGIPYVKKYFDSDIVQQVVGSSQKTLDRCSNGISFLVYGADVVDTITSLSQIEANKAAFNENIDALEVLSIFGSDGNIRAAANDVMNILAGEYLLVYSSAIKGDIVESGLDLLLYHVASKVGYVAIVVAVRDVMNLIIGSKADVEQMYRILCYSDMCEVYSKSLFWKIHVTDNQRYYYCYNQDNVIHINRYMENIAQLRILGEQEYYQYIKGDGLLGFIGNYISGLEKLKKELEDTIMGVKKCAASLQLKISSKIQYAV